VEKKDSANIEQVETQMTEKTAAKEKKTVDSVPTEGQLTRAYNSFREQLAAEEHVDIMIPPTQLYPEGSNLPICLNGVTYTVPVGIMFEKGVPKSIYNVWKESYEADREARQKMKKALTGVISVG
jgi:hypothetical protein